MDGGVSVPWFYEIDRGCAVVPFRFLSRLGSVLLAVLFTCVLQGTADAQSCYPCGVPTAPYYPYGAPTMGGGVPYITSGGMGRGPSYTGGGFTYSAPSRPVPVSPPTITTGPNISGGQYQYQAPPYNAAPAPTYSRGPTYTNPYANPYPYNSGGAQAPTAARSNPSYTNQQVPYTAAPATSARGSAAATITTAPSYPSQPSPYTSSPVTTGAVYRATITSGPAVGGAGGPTYSASSNVSSRVSSSPGYTTQGGGSANYSAQAGSGLSGASTASISSGPAIGGGSNGPGYANPLTPPTYALGSGSAPQIGIASASASPISTAVPIGLATNSKQAINWSAYQNVGGNSGAATPNNAGNNPTRPGTTQSAFGSCNTLVSCETQSFVDAGQVAVGVTQGVGQAVVGAAKTVANPEAAMNATKDAFSNPGAALAAVRNSVKQTATGFAADVNSGNYRSAGQTIGNVGAPLLLSGAAAATPAADADHIVIGLRSAGLEATANKIGGSTFLNDADWQMKFQQALSNPQTKFTVSLDGLNGNSVESKVMQAVTQGSKGVASGGATNWEIAQLYQANRLGSVDFIEGGQIVANPYSK